MRHWPLVVVIAACGGAPAAKAPTSKGVDADEAVEQARSLVEEAYGSLRRGDANGLLPLLAPDVYIIGPGASQILPPGSDALVSLSDWLGGTKHKLKSRDLQVVAGAGGHSAWATDQIELDGATYAMTTVLTEDDELWHFRMVHVARTWKPKQLDKQTRVPGGALPAGDADNAVLELAEEAIGDLEARLEQLPDAEGDAGFDAVVLSTAPRGATHGVKKITKAWNKLLKPKKKKKKKPPPPLPVTEIVGDAGSGVTSDGSIAWVVANVETEGDPPEPHRMLLLYAQDAGEWRLMLLQDAAIVQ